MVVSESLLEAAVADDHCFIQNLYFLSATSREDISWILRWLKTALEMCLVVFCLPKRGYNPQVLAENLALHDANWQPIKRQSQLQIQFPVINLHMVSTKSQDVVLHLNFEWIRVGLCGVEYKRITRCQLMPRAS